MQWIISSFTNDPEQLARLAGLVKGVLAGGVAAAFGTEAAGLTQLNVVAYNFSMQAVGLVLMAIMAWTCVTATSYKNGESAASSSVEAEAVKDMEKSDRDC